MAGKLKPLDIERQIKPGKYADGDGLYLIVTGPTSKNWSYRYWKDGKERWHGLGSFKDVSLKEARLAARCGAASREGRSQHRRRRHRAGEAGGARGSEEPSRQRKRRRRSRSAPKPTSTKIGSAGARSIATQWPSSLKRYAYPTIGKLTIAEIRPSHIHELLEPIWIEKRETANRVRGRIETIIAKNVDVDDKDFRNPAELTKQLREKLPKRPSGLCSIILPCPTPMLARFMTELSEAAGTAALMLRFLILTACRTNEVVEARWSEIDRTSSTWRIPGERMKMNQDHEVPSVGSCAGCSRQDA